MGIKINWAGIRLVISSFLPRLKEWWTKITKGGSGMKTVILLVILACLVMPLAKASDVTLKQGALMTWEHQQFKNLTCVNIAETTQNINWPKWANAIWSGWDLDVAWVYDASTLDDCALLLGRKVGTLGGFLPINYPLLDKIDITVYPIGLYATSLFDHPQFQGCSGGALVKLGVQF